MEVKGILREADAHGFERFHLVGYSGGGASSLAFTAEHSERLLSLALLEPAWAPATPGGRVEAIRGARVATARTATTSTPRTASCPNSFIGPLGSDPTRPPEFAA